MKDLEGSIENLENDLKIYPIWLCAFILYPNPGLVHPKNMNSSEMYVDIGLYGTPHVNNYEPRETTRKIEKFVRDVNGLVIFNYLILI